MAEWRLGRGWAEAELADRLSDLRCARKSFREERPSDLRRAAGWHPEESRSIIAREPAGPPVSGGPFERAAVAIENYEFSDPTIVTGHFDPSGPLLGRRMLLEIRVLGLRYLCGVVVGEVTCRDELGRSTFGFRYDTLVGHIERGAEWFLVTKEHGTGDVHFRIESRWRSGDFPNRWSRLGFKALGGLYRRLWLRRAHERLRALVTKHPAALRPPPGRMAHEGEPARALPRAAGGRRPRLGTTMAVSAGLGLLTGMRSMSGPALVAWRSAGGGPRPGGTLVEQRLASPGLAAATAGLAVGEALADKLPFMRPRTEPVSVLARLAMGAGSAAAVAKRWERPPWLASLVAAAGAGAGTLLSYRARRAVTRRLGVPSAWAGLVEDGVVLAGMVGLVRAVASLAPDLYGCGCTRVRLAD